MNHSNTTLSVPSASPTAGNGTAESSSVIIFSWNDPPALNLNGNLRYFRAIVTEIPTGRNWSLIAVESHITLASLHPYYNYSCKVAAYTIGLGPYSKPFYAITKEEGSSLAFNKSQKVINYMQFPYSPRCSTLSATSAFIHFGFHTAYMAATTYRTHEWETATLQSIIQGTRNL